MLALRVFVLAALFAATTGLQAESFRLSHTFRAAVPEPSDLFGTAVAIDDGVVAIKSHSGYVDGDGFSRTHVFEQGSDGRWAEAATFDFDSGDNNGNPFIGEELDIDNGVIAVGYGPLYTEGTSRAPLQVLTRDAESWSRTSARLADINPPVIDPFEPDLRRRQFAGSGQRPAGRTVGVSGDFIIAEESGAPRPGRRSQTGVARIFQRQSDGSWMEESNVFTRSARATGLSAAAMDGDTAALVYRRSTDQGQDTPGRGLYFFQRQPEGHWAPTEHFGDVEDEDSSVFYFRMIELEGDTAVTRDLITGELSTYQRVDGVWRETLGPGSTENYNSRNGGFALDGDVLARTVGGVLDEPAAVEVYRRGDSGDWNLFTTLADPDPDAALDFGARLAMDGGRLLVGAKWTDGIASGLGPAGAAYLYVLVPEPGAAVIALSLIAAASFWRGRP